MSGSAGGGRGWGWGFLSSGPRDELWPPLPPGYGPGGKTLQSVEIRAKDMYEDEKKTGDLVYNIATKDSVKLAKQGTLPQHIYVRNCYLEMRRKLMAEYNDRLSKGEKIRINVGGTPQVGKSTFMCFFIPYFIKHTNYKRIVVLSQRKGKNKQDPAITYYITFLDFDRSKIPTGDNNHRPKRRRMNDDEDEEEIEVKALARWRYDHEKPDFGLMCYFRDNTEDCIVFLDGFKSVTSSMDDYGPLIAFCSPGFDKTYGMDDDWGGTTLYMEPWTKNEIVDFWNSSRDVFPDNYTVNTLYDLFGGCIGYMMGNDARVMKQKDLVYSTWMRDMIAQHKNEGNIVEEYNQSEWASLYALYPAPDNKSWMPAKLAYISTCLADDISYKRKRQFQEEGLQRYYVEEMSGSRINRLWNGMIFEDLFCNVWLEGKTLNMNMFPNFENEGTGALRPGMLSTPTCILLDRPSSTINPKTGIFPLRCHKLYRFTPYTPSVDFYLIEKVDLGQNGTRLREQDFAKIDTSYRTRNHTERCRMPQKNEGYRVFLIQTTIAKKHKASVDAITEYCLGIDNQVQVNVEMRRKLREGDADDATPYEKEEAMKARSQYPFLENDTNYDLDVFLNHPNVEIWLLYVQRELNNEFVGDIFSKCRGRMDGSYKTLKNQLKSKIKTGYAYMDPFNVQ